MAEDLSRPVPGEAKNLELHVEMCARRHGAIDGKLNVINTELRYLKYGQYAALGILIAALGGGAVTIGQVVQGLQLAAQIASAMHGGAPAAAAAATVLPQ